MYLVGLSGRCDSSFESTQPKARRLFLLLVVLAESSVAEPISSVSDRGSSGSEWSRSPSGSSGRGF